MTLFLLLLLAVLSLSSCAQEPIKEWHYLHPADSSRSHYLAVRPAEEPPRAILLLLSGFNGSPAQTEAATTIPERAAERGWLCLLPTLATGKQHLGSDAQTMQSIAELVQDARKRYKLSEAPCYVGGFSIGGTAALRYAQWQVARGEKPPAAVFGIDPPLDWERFYWASARLIRLSGKEAAPAEAAYMVNRLSQELGGKPDKQAQAYWDYSVYAFRDSSQKGARLLREIPLRLYSEPDVNWWIQERGSDLYGMNALDASCLINELQRLGNSQAELLLSQDKGYRPDGTRHPHAWSIVDAKALLDWLEQF